LRDLTARIESTEEAGVPEEIVQAEVADRAGGTTAPPTIREIEEAPPVDAGGLGEAPPAPRWTGPAEEAAGAPPAADPWLPSTAPSEPAPAAAADLEPGPSEPPSGPVEAAPPVVESSDETAEQAPPGDPPSSAEPLQEARASVTAGSGNRWELVEEAPVDTSKTRGTEAETPPGAPPVMPASGHPLSHLGEVPPDAAEKLRAMGIGDTAALHERFEVGVDPEELARVLGVEARRVRRWRTLTGLMQLPSIEAEHAWLLEIAGVASLDQLAGEDPEELAQRMADLNRDQGLGLLVPDPPRVTGWVDSATRRAGHG
ncbi:MAG: DUF4332 domain-containing protein, partial [Gemmatimonadota bacterium]|nr:DUF4332 domain-containing protein [Gemmatimonadota bacterium]